MGALLTPWQRALRSLNGLSVGDALGEKFFFRDLEEIRSRQIPTGPWSYTDDTEMALSIVEQLGQRGAIDQDRLATAFAIRYNPRRGYGGAAHQLLEAIGRNPPGMWRTLTPAMFGGKGSFGNGAAMRIAPLGAFFCDDYARAAEQARLASQVTHSHPEGIAGGVAVALAAAWLSRDQAWNRQAFFETILEFTPPGQTHRGLERARDLSRDKSAQEAARELGNGDKVTAQDTVPFALWCAAAHPDDYRGAFWLTVEGRGDQDTNCAIVGGLVACRAVVPSQWVAARERLPKGFSDS